MQLKMTRDEKRAMEAEFRANGVPRSVLTKTTAIAGQHFQAALDRRKGFLARLWDRVTA